MRLKYVSEDKREVPSQVGNLRPKKFTITSSSNLCGEMDLDCCVEYLFPILSSQAASTVKGESTLPNSIHLAFWYCHFHHR
uniref:Uncharacterized protein n=1 Tax=Oryza punctata TaxID=4537 RepID=A0A0E0MI48_ORYPU